MQCQLIQTFIKLPGILGFSLMPPDQEKSSKNIYSVGFTQGRSPDQHPTLVHGVQQIIQTTPASLEHCTFQFSSHHIEIHKVENGAILLIFGQGEFADQHFKAISELIQFIKADYQALVDSIRAINTAHDQGYAPKGTDEQLPTVHIDDLLEAINSVSHITRRYLGSRFVTDYWQASQQQALAWMQHCQIEADGTLNVADGLPELTPEQLAELRGCMQQFHQQCTRFIRDYDTLVAKSLPQHHWQLLFGE
ncbi:MAG: hypothetical protein AAFY17_03285 [Cyanobacteria bacterium J06642_11]